MSNDENRITVANVNWGETVSPIDSKGKEGYTFKHWSLQINGETAFDFDTAITDNITLYAKWNVYTIEYIELTV